MYNIYNCHTHIFTLKCVPDRFVRLPIHRFLINQRISREIILFLNKFDIVPNNFLTRYASFYKYGKEAWQELIFNELKKKYPPGTRFGILTLDMDFMGAGSAVRNYLTQLSEVVELKRKYPSEVLAFVSIDPRRGSAQQNVDFVRHYIEERGFTGIKMYPPLGFFPFDSRLMKVYEYAEMNNVPIITHCARNGGVYYKGQVESQWLKNFDNLRLGDFYKGKKRKHMEVFRNNFMKPSVYQTVLERFPKLKLCFAHFGGMQDVKNINRPDSWAGQIKDYMERYENVHTDISYTLYDDSLFEILKKEVEHRKYGSRILFGTDFYMTEQDKKEEKLKDEFREHIYEENFRKIAHVNPVNFLSSRFWELESEDEGEAGDIEILPLPELNV